MHLIYVKKGQQATNSNLTFPIRSKSWRQDSSFSTGPCCIFWIFDASIFRLNGAAKIHRMTEHYLQFAQSQGECQASI